MSTPDRDDGPTRRERDSLGEVEVPADALYGAQTERARRNFPVSGYRISRPMIRALALIKGVAAGVNAEHGDLEVPRAEAIAEAAAEVRDGRWNEEFVVDVFQTGSGTSSNMNANEVVARRAGQLHPDRDPPIHPNDDVNRGQSSNDVIPTAIRLAALLTLDEITDPGLARLEEVLRERAAEWKDVVKPGRTHCQDALPVTFGQVFGGWAAQVAASRERLAIAAKECEELPLGGTAVGTGANAPAGFAAACARELGAAVGRELREARDHFAAQGSVDGPLALSAAMRSAACVLMRIADDLRMLASGPSFGLGELRLPVLQPGSSIMPDKVNPVIEEAVLMTACQVVACDHAIAQAPAFGRFELNTMQPLVAHNLCEGLRLLGNVAKLFAERSIAGCEVAVERLQEALAAHPVLVTALAPSIGYDRAAKIAKTAREEGRTIRDVAREATELDPEELDRLLDPLRLARPHETDRPPGESR